MIFDRFRFGGGRRPDHAIGAAGEKAAARFLRRAGYRILARNAHVPMGEADLVCVAPDGETRVIVEVKTRRLEADAPAHHAPEVAVDDRKRRKLVRIARHLARANGWRASSVRIDVIGVEWRSGERRGRPEIRHHAGRVRLG